MLTLWRREDVEVLPLCLDCLESTTALVRFLLGGGAPSSDDEKTLVALVLLDTLDELQEDSLSDSDV
jgi:hypothetical protein